MAAHAPNLTNTLYRFAVETVNAANSGVDALAGADVQESDADAIKEPTTIRIGSSTSKPSIGGEGIAKEFSGVLAIEFVVRPVNQTLTERTQARETAHQMAMEFITAIANNPCLNGRSCDCLVTKKEDGYRNIGTVRHQVAVIEILNNLDS